MTIIILGSNGMLGSMIYFLSKTQYSHIPTIAISKSDFDVLHDNINKLDTLLPDNNYTIINCIGAIPQKKYTPDEYAKINTTFPQDLSEYCKIRKYPFIHISTNCVFSGKKDNYLESDIPDTDDIYGKSKLELLNWIEQRDLPFLWTRTFFQFGLNEPTGKLIPSIIDAILKGDSFEVQNEHDVRDFIYINDVVSALDVLICQEELGIINLGTGSGTAIRSITDLIANKMGRNDLIQYKSIHEATSTVVSNPEKLLSRISDHRWTPLDLAITETIRSRSKLFYLKTNNMKI